MPLNNILPSESFLFISSLLKILMVLHSILFFILYSSFTLSGDNNNNSSQNNSDDIKRFVKRRSGWKLFLKFLEGHYEFTMGILLRELCDGMRMSPNTVRQYLYYAKEAGWVEVRAVVRRGRRRVYIYRSRLYNQGEGR